MRMSLSMAPVAPEPQKTTTSSGPPLTASWMTARACPRSSVVRPAGGRGLGVGVAVHRQHLLADEVLDEAQ
jgi:hypothetical protein